jgi:hypothetical protein
MIPMNYDFTYQTTAFDLWRLSMYGIYKSILGLCNAIFTVAMVLLAYKYWAGANDVLKLFMALGMSLFTVIQPMLVYLKAKRQVKQLPKEINLHFDDFGVHINTLEQNSSIKWKDIKGVLNRPGMVVIMSSHQHGFILTDKVLRYQRKEFIQEVTSKIKSQHRK